MLKSYIKVAFRSLAKNKVFSSINIIGLSFGITCSILLMLYLKNELAYDKFNTNADNIYRIGAKYTIGGVESEFANIARPVAPTLKKEFPEVLEFARFIKYNRLSGNPVTVRKENEKENGVEEDLVFFADSSVFKVFSYNLIKGNPDKALTDKFTAVVTEDFAQRLFGDENPVGKVITFDNNEQCKVTGVIENLPGPTHLDFEVLISYATFHNEADWQRWIGGHVYSFLLMNENHNINEFAAKWPGFFDKYMSETFNRMNAKCDIIIQPLTDIHLYSNLQWEVADNGNIVYVYVLAVVAVFILIIACINYVNLTTARSTVRAKEVGVRKAIGANRNSLINQFLSESVIISVISIFISVVFTFLLLPFFNTVAGKQLEFNLFSDPLIFAGIMLIGFFVNLVSGIYPAFYLSAFIPVDVLKDKLNVITKRFSLRQMLVIVQFAISVIIIIGIGIVNDQLQFVKNKDLGFDKENVLAINIKDKHIQENIRSVKNEFVKIPGVVDAATSYNLPGKDLNKTAFAVPISEGNYEENEFQFMQFDYDYARLMGLEIIKGRNFDETMTTDKESAVIINEATVNKFGWEDPVGLEFRAGPTTYTVIGVIKDFHVESLHNSVAPVAMFLSDPEAGWLYLKLKSDNLSGTMGLINEQWESLQSAFPINYVFVDENFNKLYNSDEKLSEIFRYSAIITIFISCLGLLGLSVFTAEQKIKSVAVRKVLGASVPNILIVLSKEFLLLLIISNVIAWPVAYYFMNEWLTDFAYRINIGFGNFIFATVISILIAFATISYQTIKSASVNPVKLLRYE